jgi:hypothetical protein
MSKNTTYSMSTSNNQNLINGSYTGFSILIRNKNGVVNSTKLVKDINMQEGLSRKARNSI